MLQAAPQRAFRPSRMNSQIFRNTLGRFLDRRVDVTFERALLQATDMADSHPHDFVSSFAIFGLIHAIQQTFATVLRRARSSRRLFRGVGLVAVQKQSFQSWFWSF